jgi:glycosyltransferase involved in cell wall biosynthesis
VATSLAEGLARLGHAVTVCTTDAGGRGTRLPRSAVGNGPQREISSKNAHVDVRVFPNLSNTLAYEWQAFMPLGLSAYLRRHAGQFDIAHLHACRNLPGVLAAGALGRANVPYLLAPNGTAPRIERRRFAKALFDAALGRAVSRGAAGWLAVSRAERRDLVALGVPPSKIRLIPNPVETDEVSSPPARGSFRRAHGLGTGPLVLYLGRVSPRKRVDLLVEAVARLARPGVTLVIAGNDMGATRAVVARARAVGLGDSIRFTGLLTGATRLQALVDADVVAYPGEREVFGLVAAESLLCGTPVVVADDSGCGELVDEAGGGLTVPVGDADALACAVDTVLATPDRWRARAREARASVVARFGVETVCRRLDQFYREVVAARSVDVSRVPAAAGPSVAGEHA